MNTLFSLKDHTTKNNFAAAALDFQTPPHVCDYMVSLLPPGVKTVLEPTPGKGNIVKALGPDYDITAPKDFFLTMHLTFDAIVMNPPFSYEFGNLENAPVNFKKHRGQLGYQILLECMKMSDIVICLLPWYSIINSNNRVRHLQKFGLRSLTQISRSTFQKLRVQCVIIELNKGYCSETVFKIID